jgi:uncharacterized membrane protein
VALAVLAALGLGCMDSRSTEPSTVDPAFAKGGGASDPTVTSADPAAAPQDTTLDVHVFGSSYDQGSRVDFARAGVVDPKLQVNSTTFRSSTELVANVTVAPDAATVSYDIVVTKSTGKKGIGTEKFAVLVPGELLSAPSGGSRATSVSENGLISGWIRGTCAFDTEPVLWDQLGQLTALPALPGTCGGIARDVNGTGVAVGSAYIGSSYSYDVRWVPLGGTYQAEPLPRLANGSLAGASGMNDAGTVAGSNVASVLSPGATSWQLLQWPIGATSCLGSLGINNLGAVAGRCTIAGKGRAAYWTSPTGSPVLLPLPSGATDVFVRAINDAGVIVGWTFVSTGKNKVVRRATRWIPSGGSWTPEILPDLGKGGSALAINQAGQIAGSVPGTNGFELPALWEASGALRQLDTGDKVGEATGLAGPGAGSMVAGNINSAGDWHAARWRP